jgi:predicted Fe-Mo cluster-binding NifX family protein
MTMRLGLPLAAERLDGPLSAHFGKAPWLAVVEAGAPPRFLRNEGQSGGWVAGALAEAGVTDVVADHLGGGAHAHLAEAGLRVWQGDATSPAEELIRRCLAGQLAPLAPPSPDHAGHGHGGCGCGGH